MSLLFFLTLFLPIEEKIPSIPFSYHGKNEREILTVDPQNSPLIDEAYQELLSALDPSFTETEILEWICHFVESSLFNRSLSHEVKKWIQVGEEIPLELFIEKKTGICRHWALTTSLLVQRLIQDEWLKGEVFLIRDDLPFGRHGWTLFLSEQGAWHLDPYLGILENGKTPSGFLRLCQKYGKHVMDRHKLRWANDS